MMKAILFAVALGSAASARVGGSPVESGPYGRGPASLTQEVRVVCEANGVCYRPPKAAGRQMGLW